MAQLSCRNLYIGYDGKSFADDINLEINKGDYLAVVGENGAGKSTLIKTILGLIKPVSGQVEFEEGLHKRDIGYLPQQTVVQKDFPASVFEVVISGCLSKTGLKPFYGKKEKEEARNNIEKMGLKGLEKKSYRELSGGQQQRVLLARALCATDKILLLDEPVSGLDPVVSAEMYNIINSLNEEGTTIIMITHDVNTALKYANKILHIKEKTFFGTKDEYLADSDVKNYIGKGESNHE